MPTIRSPGTAPPSGYSSPFYALPRSSSTGSLPGLPAFPGPLNLAPPGSAYDTPSLDRLSLS